MANEMGGWSASVTFLCASTTEHHADGRLLRCERPDGHDKPSGEPHARDGWFWSSSSRGAGTYERATLGVPGGQRCPSIGKYSNGDEFRCQRSVNEAGHKVHMHVVAKYGLERRWDDRGEIRAYAVPVVPCGAVLSRPDDMGRPLVGTCVRGYAHLELGFENHLDEFGRAWPVVLPKVDYFADSAIDPKWTDPWDPRAATPNIQRVRSFDEPARWPKCGPDCPCDQEPAPAPLTVPTEFRCECGATVAVGSKHVCSTNGWRPAPMRSAGPVLDSWQERAAERAAEQERIDTWDEYYDDHLPRGWGR